MSNTISIRSFTKTCRTSEFSANEVFRLSIPDLILERGKITVVTGSNGCGKSTFAQVVCGADKPDDKKSVVNKHLNVGYMPQRCVAFHTSICKNLMLNAGKRKRAEAQQRAAFLMNVLHLDDLESADASNLSGGETARVSFARLLMNKYDILILDDPTTSMDAPIIPTAEELMRQYCEEENCALILVSSSLSQTKKMADNIIFLDAGKVIETGTAEKVLNNPDSDLIRKIIKLYR